MLCAPAKEGEFVFATDAHHAIRIPSELVSGEYKQGDGRLSRVFALDNLLDTPVVIEVKDLESAIEKAPMIDEFEQVECENCDGEGDVYCAACENSHKCKKCDGEGVSDGKKIGTIISPAFRFIIGDQTFNAKFFPAILSVQKAVQQPIQILNYNKSKHSPMLLGIGPVQVLIMPMMDSTTSEKMRIKIKHQ